MIVVFGSINLDLIFSLPVLPMPGQTLLARSARVEPGGKGANQAVAAARDGATVVMAGAVAGDALAPAALAGLASAGVDLSRVATVGATTGCAVISTDANGLNQIIVAAGANALAGSSQVEDRVLTPSSIVLLQMETDPGETAALILRAKARGARVILNLAPALDIDAAVLRALDVLVVNEDEAAFLARALGCGSDAKALHSVLGITVIRTLGARGAEAAGPNGDLFTPAEKIEVVDSTAAGDCFTGVLAAALDRGDSLDKAMARAAMAAALACTRAGSQGSIPDRLETDAALMRKVSGNP